MSVGKNIKRLRKRAGLIQKELAQICNVVSHTVLYWEKDKQAPTYSHIKKLCEIFKVTEAELFGGIPPETLTDAQNIKIVGTVRADGLVSEKKPTQVQQEDLPTSINIESCEACVVKGSSMFPLAKENDVVVYCTREEEIKDGDLVLVKLKNDGKFFKRYHPLTAEDYLHFTKGMRTLVSKRDRKGETLNSIMLYSINPKLDYKPIICTREEVEYIYKVKAVYFK